MKRRKLPKGMVYTWVDVNDGTTFDTDGVPTKYILDIPQGNMVSEILELEKKTPGTFSIEMGGIAYETEELDGVTIVRDFEIQRITMLLSSIM